jgi:hypothetical protein
MSDELLKNDDSFLELSDDEIMNMDFDSIPSGTEAEEGDQPSEAESDDAVEAEEPTEEAPEDDVPEDTDDSDTAADDSSDTDDDSAEDKVDTQDVFDGTDEPAESVDDAEDDAQDEPESDKTDDGIDYKAEYMKVLAPFKANGKEIKVDSVDEAIQLMQMGANYTKKMSGLKPHMKLLKMLENNSLLEESKLNYLIDLDKKNPDAIRNLIKESGIDPLDIDTSDKTSYKPQSYTVDEREIELDSVLEGIQHTDSYGKTVDLISNKWDEASRKIIVQNPQVIQVINEHMSNGIYAQIDAVMTKERALGRLNGKSDIEAYREIGDRIFAQGGFAQQPAVKEPAKPTPKPKKQADPKVVNRKKAAAPTKTAPTSQAKDSDFNPLSMSDDEFDKLVASKFL